MNLYKKLMKKLENRIKEKADFKDKNILRNNIVDKIIEDPSNIGILFPCYEFKKNQPLYKNDKIYLIPNLTMTDITNRDHFVYVKLGYNYEDHVRGFKQLDKLQSYIRNDRLDAKGYLLMSDKKYNSVNDFLDKLIIHQV